MEEYGYNISNYNIFESIFLKGIIINNYNNKPLLSFFSSYKVRQASDDNNGVNRKQRCAYHSFLW